MSGRRFGWVLGLWLGLAAIACGEYEDDRGEPSAELRSRRQDEGTTPPIDLDLHVRAGAALPADGTLEHPFPGPAEAIEAVRAARANGMDGHIAISLSGEHFIERPVVIDGTVAGGPSARLTLRSEPGQVAAIRGARRLLWTRREGPLFVADIPADVDPSWQIEHVRVRSRSTFRARHPNYDPESPNTGFLTIHRPSLSAGPSPREAIVLGANEVPSTFDLRGALLDVYVADSWENAVVPIASVSEDRRTLRGNFVLPNTLGPTYGSRFVVQNVRQAVDQPGEWFHDVAAKQLIYLPRPDDDFYAPEPILAARATSLVRIVGSATARVHDVAIRGIELSDTNGTFARPDAAVVVGNADRIEITDSVVHDVNGMGIVISDGASFVTVAHNRLERLGSTAIAVFGRAAAPVHDVTIEANQISRAGRVVKEGRGIHLHEVDGVRVVRNVVSVLPRAGIQATGSNVVIEENVVRHVGRETADLGALAAGGSDGLGVTWRHNLVHAVVGLNTDVDGKLVTSSAAHGFYGDTRASRHTLVGNVFTGTMTRTIVIHGGWDNTIEGNALLDTAPTKMMPFLMQPREAMRRNRFERNVLHLRPTSAAYAAPVPYWDPLSLSSSANVLLCADADRAALWASTTLTPEGGWSAWRAKGFDANSNWATFSFAAVRSRLPGMPPDLLALAERDASGNPAADLLAQLPVGPRPAP